MMDSRCLARLCVVTLLVLFFGFVVYDQAAAELRIFELQNRTAGELAEVVRALVGDDGKVTAYRNTLLVNASQAELAEVARLVASYDRTQRMLRVSVRQGHVLNDQNREIDVSGRLQEGAVSVDLGNPQRESPPLRPSTGSNQVNVRLRDDSRQENRQVSQLITVMEGSPARISVGRSVPFTSQMLVYCRRHPAFIETIDYHNVDTGFEVLPVVFDNMVELEIMPFMAFLDAQTPDQIVFQELSTRVRIPLGTWYELGAGMNTLDGLSREIVAGGRHAASVDNAIRLRVDPE